MHARPRQHLWLSEQLQLKSVNSTIFVVLQTWKLSKFSYYHDDVTNNKIIINQIKRKNKNKNKKQKKIENIEKKWSDWSSEESNHYI